jgi:hypothetical protein
LILVDALKIFFSANVRFINLHAVQRHENGVFMLCAEKVDIAGEQVLDVNFRRRNQTQPQRGRNRYGGGRGEKSKVSGMKRQFPWLQRP